MFNKKRDQIFLFYIVFSDGLKLYKGCTHIPIGLLSIGTFLQERNYQIKLICDRYPDMDEIKRAISYSRVRVAGFYTSTDNIYRVIEISKFIKQNFPGIIIIFGGPHATVRPVEVLEGSPADIVVRYEGEYTMLDLMNYFFLDEGKLENIPGIVYRDGNSIKSNPLRPCIDNLDELPIINRDLAPTREGVVSILTGRGCPYECTFCFQATGHYHRMRSIEHVLKELDEVLNTYDDPLYLGFIDDTFIAHPERTIKLC
ncbi:MAG TPA: cobalamin-dependent protein, partial [Candidatus Eremiobacteraeota bacterium]|nr:cobalamin-dependent protein [Candidatus Eremiobacteraeota bacterium]